MKQQLDALVAETQKPRGFTLMGLNIAANWSLQNSYHLEKGLEWATLASSLGFPGDPTSFAALCTKAALLDKLGRTDEAAAVIKLLCLTAGALYWICCNELDGKDC